MRISLIATAAVAAIAVGSGTASAQVVIPHKGHYHVVPTAPIRPAFVNPGFVNPGLGVGYGVFPQPRIVGYPSFQPNYIQPSFIQPNYFGGPILVPHTKTHLDLVPHRGHFHVVPHTTTHFHVIRP